MKPYNVICEPGSSRSYETGTWRTYRPKYLHDKCTSCKMCVQCCPEGIIKGEKKDFEPDLFFCKGCGICAAVCPVKDITMELEVS